MDITCLECGNVLDDPTVACDKCGATPHVVVLDKQSYFPIGAVTANLEKNDSRVFDYRLGEVWDLKNEVASEFITRIEKKFSRKNKFHNFLDSDSTPFSIPIILKKYINKNNEFTELSKTIIDKLKYNANNESRVAQLQGGCVVFIHYRSAEPEDLGRLLIVMVDKQSAYDFDSDKLTPTRLNPINTDALRQAAMFDLTLFEASYPENKGDSYVHFLQGKSKSDFFKESLGCRHDSDNKRSIQQLFSAIDIFANKNSLGRVLRDMIDNEVKGLLDKKSKDKSGNKSVKIEDISKIIDQCLIDTHECRGTFVDFVNINGFQIDPQFEPTPKAAESALTIEVADNDNNFKLKIMRGAIGDENSNKPVILTDNKCEVVIKLSQADYDELKRYRDS
ncbi:nucleoid-associated protein YejK [Raoultella ornithinolytica]|uniref:Nucleoid-associated protein YejK n=1 Tax=Raoultella ornithinolytica TaxID=54291 RepID=A0ABD7QNH0_RAOOR|nr:nucleoid-associated protein [Raoultella terrigena]QIT28545.1 nucleoid-associated protein [Raoultella terrigena]TCQ76257.1 nucleoid-associated protein YejK [Raoultella ornithinolytica]SUQ57665.1 Nucleoid-associated protein YejK [Raoultella terrigena]